VLTQEDIYWSLCSKDPRHPLFKDIYGDEEPPPVPRDKPCYCDSCFRGKDKLAVEILRLREVIAQQNKEMSDAALPL
jgi:hypothetical protein